MEEGLIYKDISFGNDTGKLRLVPGLVFWRQDRGHNRNLKLTISEFVKVTFMKVPKSYHLYIHMKDGKIYSFRGFKKMDRKKATSFFSKNGIQAVEEEVSVSGKNWGDIDITGHNLSMTADKKTVFHCPLDDVSNVKVLNKNEVTIEFNNDDSMSARENDTLLEMKFYVPDTNPVFGVAEGIVPAQAFKNLLDSQERIVYSKHKAAIVEFDSINVINLTTGVCSFKMHLKHFILEHKEKEFKILYQRVVSIIVMQKSTTCVIIGISPSLLIDQTRIPDIVLQFENNAEVHKNLRVNKTLFEEKLKGKLDKSYQGIMHDVFIRVFGGLSGVVPFYVSGRFVKLFFKNNYGNLYLLEESMFFVPTPSTQIHHDEILVMEILEGSEGSFDLRIELKTKDKLFFTQLREKDYGKVLNYIESKDLGNLNAGKR